MNAIVIVFCFLILFSFQLSQNFSYFKQTTNEIELSLGFYRSYEKLLAVTCQKHWQTLLEKKLSNANEKTSKRIYHSPRQNLQYTKNAKVSLFPLIEDRENLRYRQFIEEYLQKLYGRLFEQFSISSAAFLNALIYELQRHDLELTDLSNLVMPKEKYQKLYYEMLKGHQEFSWNKINKYFPSFLDIFHLSSNTKISFYYAPTPLLHCLFEDTTIKNILSAEQRHYEEQLGKLNKGDIEKLLFSSLEHLSLELFNFKKSKKDRNTVQAKDKKTNIRSETKLQENRFYAPDIQQAKSLT